MCAEDTKLPSLVGRLHLPLIAASNLIMSQLNQQKIKRDWEYIPGNCLLTILKKIDVPVTLVQFGAVSKHWHSIFNIFLEIRRRSSTNMVPMLLIPSKNSTTKRKLYSLQSKSKVSQIEFSKPNTKRFCGSSHGWLATVDENLIITLSNPFNDNVDIDLPQLHLVNQDIVVYQNKIKKIVLSDDPLLHPDSYVVVALYSSFGRLAFYKSGQKNWIYIDEDRSFSDVIFYKKLVYAIGKWNHHFVSFDINEIEDDGGRSKSPKLNIMIRRVPFEGEYWHRVYLVKSSMGNLYSIHKYLDLSGHETNHSIKSLNVFKLILDDKYGEILEKKEVESVDGDIVFVGDNQTLAVSALDFPEGEPNSIYFTDDYFDGVYGYVPYGPQDIGIFRLKDKSLRKYYDFKSKHRDLAPYIWISPLH